MEEHVKFPEEAQDIVQALHQAEEKPALESSSHALEDIRRGAIALSEAHRKNPFLYLWWGIRSAMQKVSWEAQEHPWWSALGFFSALVCAQICIYFGFTILSGLMCWAIRKRTSIPRK